MTPRVINAICTNDYKIQLTFTNDEKRLIDIEPYLNFGVFTKLNDQDLFKQVKVAFGTIEWPGGVDLDPEFVWQKSISIRE